MRTARCSPPPCRGFLPDFSKITKEDWYSLYHEQMPGAKEAYRLLNTLYNEGLISENFAIDNGDIRDRDLNQGYAGFYIEGPTQVWPDYSDEMKKTWARTPSGSLLTPS